jgi:hypothetical protein
VTGSVAAIIGFGLAFAALDLAAANWAVAIITLLATIFFCRCAEFAWRFLLEVIIEECVFHCFHRLDKGECKKWLQKRKQILVRASQKQVNQNHHQKQEKLLWQKIM